MLVFLWQLQMSFQKLKLWSRLWLWIYSGHFDQFGQIEISKGDRFLFQIWEVDEERQFPWLIFWKRCFLEGSRDRGRRENKGLAPKRLKSLTIGRLGHWLLYFVLSLYFNWLDSLEALYARVRQNRFTQINFFQFWPVSRQSLGITLPCRTMKYNCWTKQNRIIALKLAILLHRGHNDAILSCND